MIAPGNFNILPHGFYFFTMIFLCLTKYSNVIVFNRGPPRFDGERRFGGDRDGYRGGPRGPGGDFGDKGGAPADYRPSFGVSFLQYINQHYYCLSICLFYCLLLFCMLTIFSCMLMCVVTLWSSFDYKADFDRVVRVSNNIGISPSKKLR